MEASLSDIKTVSEWRTQGFRVGTREFHLPLPLLAIHSKVLAELAEPKDDKDSESEVVVLEGDNAPPGPIVLDDDENDFDAFCDALLVPYVSCLEADKPDLARIIGVFKVAQKYSATFIERRARLLTLKLTHPSTIKNHLDGNMDALKVVKAAHHLACDEPVVSAWKVAMDEFKDEKREIAEMINAAESTGRNHLIGEAYYETMLRGLPVWKLKKEGLSDRQIHNIFLGMTNFTAKSVEFLHAGLRQATCSSTDQGWDAVSSACPYTAFTFTLERRCAVHMLPSFDFLGMLQIASSLNLAEFRGGYQYPRTVLAISIQNMVVKAWATLEAEKAVVWKYFQDEEEPNIGAPADNVPASTPVDEITPIVAPTLEPAVVSQPIVETVPTSPAPCSTAEKRLSKTQQIKARKAALAARELKEAELEARRAALEEIEQQAVLEAQARLQATLASATPVEPQPEVEVPAEVEDWSFA